MALSWHLGARLALSAVSRRTDAGRTSDAVIDLHGMAAFAPGRRGTRSPNYIPLFWRIFIPNATVLGVAGAVLAAEPANGRVAIILAGALVMLTANLIVMRRSFAPLSRLAVLMQRIDPLRPGQRVPVLGPPSEATLVAEAFNQMLDRLERERRESARREVSAQQAVRRHVARELHDDLGQDLTALALQLDRMATGAVEDMESCAAQARDTALEAVETLRALARQLRPEVLDDLGLKPALVNLCARLSQRTGLRIETRLDEVPGDLDPDTELALFRVIQESLTNVLRHARATRATVELSVDAHEILAAVEDDGVGMVVDRDLRQGGLRQMHERVLLIDGTLDIDSAPGGGTRVRLHVPRGGP
jgi:two-component system sensor histidine kinase UhpB